MLEATRVKIPNKARRRLATIIAQEAWQFKDFYDAIAAFTMWLGEADPGFISAALNIEVQKELFRLAAEEEGERIVAEQNVT